jgi:hypothetical protein
MPGRFAHPRPRDQFGSQQGPAKKGGVLRHDSLRYTQAVRPRLMAESASALVAWIPARGLRATIRKRIEEAFGWIKTVAGRRR